MERSKSNSDETKETSVQKFFREREEKRKKREERELKRKAREAKKKRIKETSYNKAMPMTGRFPTNPAIYKLVHNETGEVFVSYSKNMSNGVKKHLSALRNGSHVNPDLQEDYKNIHTFRVEILREYNYYDKKIIEQDAKEFIESENSYHRGYNRYSGGGYNPYENNPNHDTGRRLDGSPSSP